jgi:hypothetical protein
MVAIRRRDLGRCHVHRFILRRVRLTLRFAVVCDDKGCGLTKVDIFTLSCAPCSS